MNTKILDPQSAIVASANRYAAQLRLLHPDWTWSQCMAQAQREAHGTQRHWKHTKAGNVVTAQSLRAIRNGQADMREKPVACEVGDLLSTFGNL